MTTVKKSFFEKLVGAKRIDDDEEMNNTFERDHSFSAAPEIYSEDTETEVVFNSAPRRAAREEVNFSAPAEDGEGQLTIDVYQTDTDVVIKSTIAGVKPEDLDVSIVNDMITIRGERKQEEEIHEENYYYQECYWGSFSRSIILPIDVMPDKIEASMKNGILTIRMPKADNTRTKKIQVRGF